VIRPQFRLRTLFVIVAIAAVPCGWLAWKMDHKRRERAAVATIRKLGGTVYYNYDYEGVFPAFPKEPPGPAWLRRVFGDDFFAQVVTVAFARDMQVDAAALAQFETLTSTRDIYLVGTTVTDAGLALVRECKNLKVLDLKETSVTDVGVSQLGGLANLEFLDLSSTKIGDGGLNHLKSLSKLRQLILLNTAVSDAGSSYLKALTNLEFLDLGDTNVTAEGVAALHDALPDCRIRCELPPPGKAASNP
jgi:hypothetical protein